MTYASTGHKTRRGLDDAIPAGKKRKRTADDAVEEKQPEFKQSDVPRIMPGERMGDYAARVDQALPVAGLARKGEGRQTRMEKRMQRMQKEWMEGDKKRRERGEEEAEEAKDGEDDRFGGPKVGSMGSKKGKKGRRRKKVANGELGELEDDDEDPWAVVAANRKRELEAKEKEKDGRGGGLVGLHDVVQAPPKFEKVPRVKVGIEDVARKGGLKKQVEMSEARRQVVEGYRRIMRERRGEKVVTLQRTH
ncbi:MAG: hypothetical protein Q9170_008119 [Blastenia crenularia]